MIVNWIAQTIVAIEQGIEVNMSSATAMTEMQSVHRPDQLNEMNARGHQCAPIRFDVTKIPKSRRIFGTMGQNPIEMTGR